MQLWIFGDSYADASFDRASIGDQMWVKQLCNSFDVQNYALRGTGPDYSLNILLDKLPIVEPVNLLWIATSISRPNVVGLEPEQQTSAINRPEYAQMYSELFATPEWCKTEEHKQFSAINSVSHQFNRVLYMPVHPIDSEIIDNIDVADNLVIFEDNLNNISISEPEYAQVSGADFRSNHFSLYNHKVLTQKTLEIFN